MQTAPAPQADEPALEVAYILSTRRPDLPFLPKLVAIQVLRGLAALAVALLHIEPDWQFRGFVPADWVAPLPLAAGVDIFFVISGFVMVYASGRLFGRPGASRLFLTRRVARVAPLYWLTTIGVLLLLLVKPDLMRSAVVTPALAVTSFLFIPWPRPDGFAQPIYSLGWTLNYEMFFYAVFAAVLALGRARRSTVALVSAGLLALVAVGSFLPGLPEPLGFWTSPVLLEFALGMALGLARAEGLTLPWAARFALLATGILAFWLMGGDVVSRTGQHAAMLFALPSACLVASCGLAPGREPGHPAGSSAAKWLIHAGEALGDASYAIYLLHPFTIRGTLYLIDRLGLQPGLLPLTILALTVTVGVAFLCHRIVERPLMRLARHVLGERDATTSRGAP